MRKHPGLLCCLGALLALAGCDNPDRLLRGLQDDISAYAAEPNSAQAQKIEAGFTRLDDEIAGLRERGNKADADRLARQTDALRVQYAAAQMSDGWQKVKDAATGVGEAFRQAGQSIGEAFKAGGRDQEQE
ncbi:MAG: hypothetical protein ACO3J2_03320 [Chthoniobacterales bacterium]|jgi:hypothetical protein